MIEPEIPTNEQDRLKALRSYEILDSSYEEVFDNFVKLASEVCETKISTISLIDQNRQWFKAKIGIDVAESPRESSFCGHAILEDELFEIEDAKKDLRFKDNPSVINAPHVAFYAGAQLITNDGFIIGTICVADSGTKKLSILQRNFLKNLAKQVMLLIELRSKQQNYLHESVRVDMIVKNAGIGTWDWNLVNNDVHFDSGWCAMLGYTIDELPHRLETWDRLCHPDDKEGAYKDISDHLSGKTSTYENIHRLKHKNGEWVYILDRGIVIHRDNAGKPLRFAGTHTDITNQKRNEFLQSHILKLREFYIKKQTDKKSFFDFLLSEIIQMTESEYGFIGEIKKDLEGNSYLKTYSITDISWNAEVKKFYDKNAPTGMEFKNLSTLFGKVIKSGEVLITNDAKGHPEAFGIPNGHPPLDKFMGIPIYGHGKFIAMIGVANAKSEYNKKKHADLKPYLEVIGELIQNHILDEELKAQQNEAHHESKLVSLGVLAAGIGHEINNPLTIIHGNLDRMLKKIERNEVTEEYLKKAHDEMFRALTRVENLIRGLRTFSRKDSILSSPINLRELIEETIDMLFQIYRADGITIEKKLNIDSQTQIMADRGKIQQILVNLMNNSRDVLVEQSKGNIVVTVYENREKVIMSISDNGPGIPKEVQDKIFDPFFTTKEVNKGTGLGLSVVADIVRLHGAKITFDSSHTGTTFYLEFTKL